MAAASITMDDIIDGSFFKTEAPKVETPKPKAPEPRKNSIIEDSFNALKEQGRKLSDIIIQDRQREAMAGQANPYLVEGLIDPPKPILKRRGRPKKADSSSVGSTTPDRTVTFTDTVPKMRIPTPTPPSPKRPTTTTEPEQKNKLRNRHNITIRIEEYIKLYPSLVAKGIAPQLPYDFTRMSDDQLEQLYKDCKEHGSSSSTGQLEYNLVSSTFYKILDNFETVCYFACIIFPTSSVKSVPNPIIQTLGYLSRQPRGSFSDYVHKCILAGDDMEKDLKEISIQLIGYLPDSPYARLAMKLAYHAYDYTRFQMDIGLQETMKRTQEKVNSMSPEQMQFFNSFMSSSNQD